MAEKIGGVELNDENDELEQSPEPEADVDMNVMDNDDDDEDSLDATRPAQKSAEDLKEENRRLVRERKEKAISDARQSVFGSGTVSSPSHPSEPTAQEPMTVSPASSASKRRRNTAREAPRQKRSKATNPALVPGWNKTAVTPVKTSGSGRASPLPAVSAFESEEQAGNQFANVKDNVAGGLKQRRTNQNVVASRPSQLAAASAKSSPVKDEKSPQKLGRAEGSTGRKARLPEWLPEEVWALSMLAYVLDRIGSERNIWDLGDDVGSRLQDIQQSTLDLMLASMPELGVEPFELKVTDALYLATRQAVYDHRRKLYTPAVALIRKHIKSTKMPADEVAAFATKAITKTGEAFWAAPDISTDAFLLPWIFKTLAVHLSATKTCADPTDNFPSGALALVLVAVRQAFWDFTSYSKAKPQPMLSAFSKADLRQPTYTWYDNNISKLDENHWGRILDGAEKFVPETESVTSPSGVNKLPAVFNFFD